jgi:prolyl oligopeptidase
MSCSKSPRPETIAKYPVTVRVDTVDRYFDTEVPDPYRWLEDDKSEQTAAWVKSQNDVTFGFLKSIPYRDLVKKRLEEIWNYPKYSAPVKTGGRYFFYKNDGLQNQSILFTSTLSNIGF